MRLTAASVLVVLVSAVAVPSGASSAGKRLCNGVGTRALVHDFVRAFNRGEAENLDRVWAREPSFRWYTAWQSKPRLGHEVFVRARLLPFFAHRHLKRERLEIVTFRFNGKSNGLGHFEYRLHRTALDLDPASRVYDGKGAVACSATPAMAVWSMGTA